MPTDAAVRVVDALRSALDADQVVPDGEVRDYQLGGMHPAAAALPRDEAQVAAALRLAHREGWGVVPWGGGAHQSRGRLPARYDVALDLRRLNRLLLYEPADMTVTVEAGVRLADLQQRLAESGQLLPLDPPQAKRATLGGVLATNLTGPLRCRYGTVRDLVLGIRVVHADGTITNAGARVVKNATAYDLTKLYVGSHGTLGVIVSATLRVQPKPACEESRWVALPSLEQGWELVQRIQGSHLVPNRLELLDEQGAQACGSPRDGAALAVSYAGGKDAVAHQAELLSALAREGGLGVSGIRAPAETWTAVQDFPWSPADRPGSHGDVLWRASVLPAESAAAMRAVRETVRSWGTLSMAATVAHGLLRGRIRSSTGEGAVHALRAARQTIEAFKGFLIVTEAPDHLRGDLDVWGPGPATIGVMGKIKTAFDAGHTLNPGRFLDGV